MKLALAIAFAVSMWSLYLWLRHISNTSANLVVKNDSLTDEDWDMFLVIGDNGLKDLYH